MRKIRELIDKYYDILAYLFFGGLTTVVNYIVYFTCRQLFDIPLEISNVIAWIVAVVFAFLTNKPFVFKSHDWSTKVLWPELISFAGCRIGSLVIESILLTLTVRTLLWNETLMKVIVSVVVVIINYFGSKFLVFTKKK